jgi:uncharacterized protein involved in exopolysaccharide biosynthesis
LSTGRDKMDRDGGRPLAAQPVMLEEEEIDLLDYVEVMVRHRWLIFWATVLCAVASVLYAYRQPMVYQAEATFLPAEQQNYLNLGTQDQGTSHSFYLNILGSVSTSRNLLQKEFEYEEDGHPQISTLFNYFGAKSMQQAMGALEGIADFKAGSSGIISIVVKMGSAQLAAAVANEYIAQLISYNTEKRGRQLKEQLAFIESRSKEIQQELGEAEEALSEFERRNRNVVSGEGTAFLTPEQRTEYSRLQRDVQIRSSLLSTVLNQYEISRVEAKKEAPEIEVLSFAEPPEIGAGTSKRKALMLGGAVGLFLSVFLAFFLEYIDRNRQSGRMDPILDEFKSDITRVQRLLGKGD